MPKTDPIPRNPMPYIYMQVLEVILLLVETVGPQSKVRVTEFSCLPSKLLGIFQHKKHMMTLIIIGLYFLPLLEIGKG